MSILKSTLAKIKDEHSYAGRVPFQNKETMLEDIGTHYKHKKLN